METILIVIHLMVVLALVGVVLLQRPEGGGLGIGGGSGFMTARGAANALTRATAILAVAFFATSLTLSIIARYGERPTDILDTVPASGGSSGGGGVLDQLGGSDIPAPSPVPPNDGASTAPAAPAAPTAVPAAPSTAPADAAPATPPAAAPAEPAAPAVPNQEACRLATCGGMSTVAAKAGKPLPRAL